MKKKLLFLLTLVAIGLSNAWAYDFSAEATTGQTLYFNIVDDNAVVTPPSAYGWDMYTKPTGALTIPSSVTYNGNTYSVTSIGRWAFSSCSGLTSVTIPNSVTSIERYAFSGCSSLTSITIPNSVTSIGGTAFSGTSLYSNNDNWTNGVLYIENCLIEADANVISSSCSIVDGTRLIADYAFIHCYGLTCVTIPNSVTSIGRWAFTYCFGLTSVTIPNSVTSIEEYTFSGCSGLTSVTIPNSVTSIGNSAFQNCSGLTCVTIPDSVTTIGDHTFAWCSSFTSVTIPNSVTSIERSAFEGCRGLTSVTIPNSVTSIGDAAFLDCNHVDTLYYNARNLTATGDWNNSTLRGFRPMKLKHLVIGDSVQTLPANVFYQQDSLTSVTIPNSVTNIGDAAFHGCNHVDTLYYNARNLTATGYWNSSTLRGFRPMKLKHLVIGDSVQTLPANVFYRQDSLTSVTIPNSVNTIGDNAFSGCSGLTSVTMSRYNPPLLGTGAFYSNASNRIITIPCGAYDNYYSSNGWFDYRSALSDPIVNINVTINVDLERGSTFIIPLRGQNVRCDSTVVVSATPNYGYHFDHWSTGNTLAQDTIAIEGDTVITAYFAKNQYTITLQSDNASLGSVDGDGLFEYLDTITLSATTIADHHHFVGWSDGSNENPRVHVVTEDMTLTAYFAIDTHRVSVVSNDLIRGMVSSTGTEFEYLSSCTVTATAYTGFIFAGWSNGETANPYTFAVQSDVELIAFFITENELFTIAVVSNDPAMGSVSGGGMAMSGGEVAIHAVANEGYHFVRWNDNDTNADRTVTVTEDATYTAYFAADQTESIDKVEQMAEVYVNGGCIVVSGAQDMNLTIYDVVGRLIVREKAIEGKHYPMPHAGVYVVRIGHYPAQKVVIIQ